MEKHGREYHIRETAESPYTPDQLYSLVAHVESYPEFLPWCKGSRIKETTDEGVVAELTVGYGPVQTSFITSNRNRSDKSIRMELVEGPLERLEGAWHFWTGKDGKTRVRLELNFRFASRRMDTLFDLVSKKIVRRIILAFKERALFLYGSPGTR